MMKRLMNFSVFEGLRKEGDVFKLDFSGDREGDLMSLKFNSHRRKIVNVNGTECETYHAFSIDNENKDFLVSLKYFDDKISEAEIHQLINKAVIGFDHEFNAASYDTIVCPKSSSKVLVELADQLYKKSGNATLIPDSLVKLERSEIKFDDEKIEKLPEKTKKEVKKMIERIRNGEGDFKLKSVFSRFRKFLSDFMVFNSENDRKIFNSIVDKNVILVDDYRTSGTTLREMKKQLLKLHPKKITVFILIDVI